MNADERNRIIASHAEWEAFGNALGWRMLHCRYDWDASFLDANDRTIYLTGAQRDDILRVISSAVQFETAPEVRS